MVSLLAAVWNLVKSSKIFNNLGGFSNAYARPSWQTDAVNKYFSTVATRPVSGYNLSGRGYPDVSFLGVIYLFFKSFYVYMFVG